QNDQVRLLFQNGTEISSTSNGARPVMVMNQRLDPGTYYVDVSNGAADSAASDGVGAVRGRHYRFAPRSKFVMALLGLRPGNTVAPVEPQASFGLAPSAGLGVEPAVDPQCTQWIDVSNNPLWGAGGPSPDDIRQGGVGDCYFLAALSDIARNNPALIQ